MMIPELIGLMIETYQDRRLTEHALKVYGYALGIGGEEGLAGREMETLCAAAVLHDIGIPKAIEVHGSAAGPYQEKEGALLGRKLLGQVAGTEEITDEVVWLIGHHHTEEDAEGNILLQVLMEADYLVNLSESPQHHPAQAAVRDAFFKTKTGIRYINTLFSL